MRSLKFNDSQSSATVPNTSFFSTGNFSSFATDADYVTAKGSVATEGNAYFNTTSKHIRFYDGTSWYQNEAELNNATTSDPTVNDDSDDGYKVLSLWLNTSTGELFRCTDNSVGAAVWTQLSSSSELSAHEADTTTHGTSGDIVGTSDAQTLTNKNIDSDNNTITNIVNANIKATAAIDESKLNLDYSTSTLDGNLNTHMSDTTTHGTTGDVVGTSDAQVITNKDIDGGTASNNNRITLPKNTTTNLDGLTDKEGTIAYDTDKETIVVNDGSDWNEISGGGAGDADTLHLINVDDLADATTTYIPLQGNNSSFDGGGSLTASSLSISTTAADLLINESVIVYDPDADGSDDYFGFNKTIVKGLRDNNIGFQFWYKNDSTTIDNDFRFCVKIKDGSNAGDISYYDLEASEKGKRYSTVFSVPDDCTELEFGIQNTTTTTTVKFHWDQILLTSSPLVYEDIITSETYTCKVSVDSSSVATITSVVGDSTNNIITTPSVVSGQIEFSAKRKCVAIISSGLDSTNNAARIEIFKNGSSIHTTVEVISSSKPSAGGGTYNLELEENDVLTYRYGTNGGTCSGIGYSVTAMSFNKHVVRSDESGSQICRYDGYSSKSSNFWKFKTRQYNYDENGDDNEKFFSDDNTSYTKFTINIPCYMQVDLAIRAGTNDMNTHIYHYDSSSTLKNDYTVTSSTDYETATLSKSFRCAKNDYFVFYDSACTSLEDTDYLTNVTVKATPLNHNKLLALPVSKENVFSARITSDDVITSQNEDFLSSVLSSSTGVYVCVYNSSFFGMTPAVFAIAETSGLRCSISNESASGCTINISDSSNTLTNSDFALYVQRQGSDYTPIGVHVGQVAPYRVMFVNVSTDYRGSNTATISYKTAPLISLQGDIFGSISSNILTLPIGQYLINFPVGGDGACGNVHARLYDNGSSSTIEEFLNVTSSSTASESHFVDVKTNLYLSAETDIEFQSKADAASGLERYARIMVTKLS